MGGVVIRVTAPRLPSASSHGQTNRAGLAFGFAAYVTWGLFPFYFDLLSDVPAIELVAHRIIWSFVLLIGITAISRDWTSLWALTRDARRAGGLALAAIFLAANWGIYVYAITSDQVVESSLGYFINPLVNVGLGVLVLHEQLRRVQWIAIGIAALAVLELTLAYGAVPWIGLSLAGTFGTYGLIKKMAGTKATTSLTFETVVLLPFALAYVALSGGTVQSIASEGNVRLAILLVLLGPVTAMPLLAFTAAATRIPLSVLGLLQYVSPTLVFLGGVFIFGESMTPQRWAGFAIIWIALALFSIDAWRHSRSPGPQGAVAAISVTEPD